MSLQSFIFWDFLIVFHLQVGVIRKNPSPKDRKSVKKCLISFVRELIMSKVFGLATQNLRLYLIGINRKIFLHCLGFFSFLLTPHFKCRILRLINMWIGDALNCFRLLYSKFTILLVYFVWQNDGKYESESLLTGGNFKLPTTRTNKNYFQHKSNIMFCLYRCESMSRAELSVAW